MAVVEQRREADLAVTELYAAHWRGLVRLAWLLLHDQGEAEDVVQDAFVEVHRGWGRLRDPARAPAYLRRAVVNRCRSALRHRGVVERYTAAGGTAPPADTEALGSLTRDALLAALSRLPQRQREVLVLRYYLDLSEQQIADALDVSPGAVKTHAHRGLLALRAGMTGTEP